MLIVLDPKEVSEKKRVADAGFTERLRYLQQAMITILKEDTRSLKAQKIIVPRRKSPIDLDVNAMDTGRCIVMLYAAS